jgi:hypothetical protein
MEERFTKWGSAEDAFKFWAERIKQSIDDGSQHKVITQMILNCPPGQDTVFTT